MPTLPRALLTGLLAAVLLPAPGCDDESPEVTPRAPKGKPAAKTTATPTAPQESLAGTWELDGGGFLDENWALFLAQVQPTIDGIRLARARVAALPAEERDARNAEIEAKMARLPAQQREMIEAAIVGTDALREKVRELMSKQLKTDMVHFVFSVGGTCTLESTLPSGMKQRAEGTWSGTGPAFSVKLTTVNGKPATGRDLEPTTLTLKKGLLHYQPNPEAPTLVAKRVGG